MRTMYDSVNPAAIPTTAALVAGYVDGRYAWHATDWARFPAAVKVRIAVFASTNDGHVLDVEQYDATPAQAPGWVKMRRAAGIDPTVYCSLSWWPNVRSAFVSQGVPEPHYWIAAYPGIGAQIYPGSVAHQYADPGPYDLSVVADYWPGVDAAPTGNVISSLPGSLPTAPGPAAFTPPAPLAQEDDMVLIHSPNGTIALIGPKGVTFPTPAQVSALLALGVPTPTNLDATTFQAVIDGTGGMANAEYAALAGQIAGIVAALQQISTGQSVDLAAVTAAATAGAKAALAGLTLKAQ